MTDLSALEVPPPGTEEYFGEAFPLAQRYAEHLATTGIEWGLIGPREIDRLWTRHILNCAVVAEFVSSDDVVGDVGSGAGLPGIPIALMRPEAKVVLIEPMERRVEWLKMVVDDLGLSNVRIVRARVEDLVDEEMFSVVTARAVKAMTTLVEWTHDVIGPRVGSSRSRVSRSRVSSSKRRSCSSATASGSRRSTSWTAESSRSPVVSWK